jgi:hypothetical protein
MFMQSNNFSDLEKELMDETESPRKLNMNKPNILLVENKRGFKDQSHASINSKYRDRLSKLSFNNVSNIDPLQESRMLKELEDEINREMMLD